MQTTSSFEKFQATKYFQSLDGIRAISILAVIWHHTISGYFAGYPIMHSGHFGVALFFVISGFLITTLLVREKTTTGQISIRNFMIRRSLRCVVPAVLAGASANIRNTKAIPANHSSILQGHFEKWRLRGFRESLAAR